VHGKVVCRERDISMPSGRLVGVANSRKVSRGLLVFRLLFVQIASKGDYVRVDSLRAHRATLASVTVRVAAHCVLLLPYSKIGLSLVPERYWERKGNVFGRSSSMVQPSEALLLAGFEMIAEMKSHDTEGCEVYTGS